MTRLTYEIVEHNSGFAYRVGDVFSETFATHAAAREAAEQAARRQQLEGSDEEIVYQDSEGTWHEEFSPADDKPDAKVQDPLPADLEARDPSGRPLREEELPSPDRAPLSDLHRRKSANSSPENSGGGNADRGSSR